MEDGGAESEDADASGADVMGTAGGANDGAGGGADWASEDGGGAAADERESADGGAADDVAAAADEDATGGEGESDVDVVRMIWLAANFWSSVSM